MPVTSGSSYALFFDILALGNPGRTAVIRVELNSSLGTIAAQSFTNAAQNAAPYIYQTKSIPFTIPSGVTNVTLRFVDLSPENGVAVDPIIDNVRINSGDPLIILQPLNRSALVGDCVNFTVNAFGTGNLFYQWRLNGTNISGATSSALFLTNVQPSQAGLYSVRVVGGLGTNTSSSATLTVSSIPFQNGGFESGLAGWTFNSGVTIIPAPPTPALNGTNSAQLGINNISGSILSQVFSAVGGSNYVMSFDMGALGDAGRIGIVRVELTSESGLLAAQNFTNNANNVPPLIYQTRSVAFTAPVTCPNVKLAFIDLSPSGGVAVDPLLDNVRFSSTDPYIITQPSNKTAAIGDCITFVVNASGTQPLSYQWKFGGNDIPGATSSILNLTNVQTNNAGVYSTRVTGLGGFINSSNATLTISSISFQNGGFESGLAGWTFNSGVANFPAPSNPALNGTNSAQLGINNISGSILSQAFPAIGGSSYVMSFDMGALGDPGRIGIVRVELTSESGLLAAQNFTNNAVNVPPIIYQTRSVAFTAPVTCPNVRLAFIDLSPSGGVAVDPLLDNVRFVRPNVAPIAFSQSVSVYEDNALSLVLVATDVDGDTLTYTVTSPSHGVLTGTAPNLTYTPTPNFHGTDSFMFKANDGHIDSALATVSITVLSVNDAPVAAPKASPAFMFSSNETATVVIAPCDSNAIVVLDGSFSYDLEGDPLNFTWLEGTNLLASGAIVTNEFNVGTHMITLAVNDGLDTGFGSLVLEVITPSQAVAELILVVNDSNLNRTQKQLLVANLKGAVALFARCHVDPAINQLEVFQNKVQVQIDPINPILAQELLQISNEIIEAAK
ncbi:MAG: Ig-like domain-containing protein [Verrucomicrobiota bacterium]